MRIFRFNKKGKCDVCRKVTMVTSECRDCYFIGFDIDKQIKRLQEMKKELEDND